MFARSFEPLYLEDPNLSSDERAQAFSDQERVNALFGVSKPVVDAVFSHEPAWVLDVACGNGDLSREILKQARRVGRRVEIVALDTSDETLDLARDCTGDEPLIRFVRGEIDYLPFPDRSFDLVVSGALLHRLDSGVAVDMLREARRVAKLSPIVIDRRRSVFGTLLSQFESRFLARGRVARHDGLAAARRSFTETEALELCRLANWNSPQISRRPYSRMILSDGRA